MSLKQTTRGPMKGPTKGELASQLTAAQARIEELEEENRQLRSGVVASQVEAPVLLLAGITVGGTPFIEPINPASPPPLALDLLAAHCTRMASASLMAGQSQQLRADGIEAELAAQGQSIAELREGMGGIERVVQEQNTSIAGIRGSIPPPPEEEDDETNV